MKKKVMKSFTLVIVLILVAGCSSSGEKATPQDDQAKAFDEFKTQLSLIVEDQPREKALFEIIDELEVDVNQLLSAISKRRQGFENLNANYNATREEFTAFFSVVNNNIEKQSKDITTKYRRFQKLLTSAEKKQLNKYNSKLIESFVNVLETA